MSIHVERKTLAKRGKLIEELIDPVDLSSLAKRAPAGDDASVA
jgi:hypothetical protein